MCIKLIELALAMPYEKSTSKLDQFRPIPRISDALVNRKDMNTPMIIELANLNLTQFVSSVENITSVCKHDKAFSLGRYSKTNTNWASLEERVSFASLEGFVAEHFKQKGGDFSAMRIFDHPFEAYCPELFHSITIPHNIAVDLRRGYEFNLDGKHLHPSLFADPAGVKSGLHIDSGGTSFWMYVLTGEKRFRIVDKQFEHFLRSDSFYDQRYHSFMTDLFENKSTRPAVTGWEGVVRAGELIFVPFDMAHQVLTLNDTLAIAMNIVGFGSLKETIQFCCFETHSTNTDCIRMFTEPKIDTSREEEYVTELLKGRASLPIHEFLNQYELTQRMFGTRPIPPQSRREEVKLSAEQEKICNEYLL
jgi:hypothetical protein